MDGKSHDEGTLGLPVGRDTHNRVPGIAFTILIVAPFLYRASLSVLVLVAVFGVNEVRAQSNPPTLDIQIRNLLALGNATGCETFLRLPFGTNNQALVNTTLDTLRAANLIGSELRAICSPSAVASASALGGALGTVQATKTVSQVDLQRRRIDSRLRGTTKPEPKRPPPPSTGTRRFYPLPQNRAQAPDIGSANIWKSVGLFGEFEHNGRDRDTTTYDLGYQSRLNGFSFGADVAWNGGVLGAWGGYSRTNADFDPVRPVVADPTGTVDQAPTNFLNNANTASAVCGGIAGGGTFRDASRRFGVFAGWTLGPSGFFDLSVSQDSRNHDYTRNVCTIEVIGSPLDFVAGVRFLDDGDNVVEPGEIAAANPPVDVLFVDGNGDGVLSNSDSVNDDVYAGAISGRAPIRETRVSLRGGYDFEFGDSSWMLSPRGVMTYTRTTVDSYIETGRNTVANPILPVGHAAIPRTLGGPVGLELAYDKRNHGSTLLEGGIEVAHHISIMNAAFMPFGSAYWRYEFQDGFINNTVRMAQDLRPDPVKFSFANDGADTTNAVFSGGVRFVAGARLTAQVEISRLAFDPLVNSTRFTTQVRWKF